MLRLDHPHLLRRFRYCLSLPRPQQGEAPLEDHPSSEESAHPFLELMPKDPHDRAALTWTYRLPGHPEVVVEVVVEAAEGVLRPEVEVVGAEVGAEVLHHPEVAEAVGAVGLVGAQG